MMAAAELRAWGRRCGDSRAAIRACAIANALDGLSRVEAARLAGSERQALRDAAVRYNAEGVSGLFNRPRGRRVEWLSENEQAILANAIFRGPKPEEDGVCTWIREALAVWISAHFGKTLHPSSLSRILRRMGLSRQKARPVHPQTDPKAQERFLKKGCTAP